VKKRRQRPNKRKHKQKTTVIPAKIELSRAYNTGWCAKSFQAYPLCSLRDFGLSKLDKYSVDIEQYLTPLSGNINTCEESGAKYNPTFSSYQIYLTDFHLL